MELYSLNFVLFLAALAVTYFGVGRILGRGQWVVLLAGSLCFYCLMGGLPTLWLVIATAAVTWAAGLALARLDAECRDRRKAAPDRAVKKEIKARFARLRRVVLLAALACCLGALGYLKYWNVILWQAGAAPSPSSLGLVLPLGISFYTFQAVGYLLDCYNGRVEAERSLPRYLLFVSYFPQLIQGPINRWADLAPQLLGRNRADWDRARRALLLFLFGAMKKYAVANVLSGRIDAIFSSVDAGMPGSVVVLGILLYSAQQYADFSGGIDMVLAASELLGVRMAPNFKRPYFAVSLADFWRRWHVSLGAWMRDYVFYPFALTRPMKALGRWSGERLGRHLGRTLPACCANVLVFLIVGVWHGAEVHYVAWGLYNGLVIAAADLFSPAFARMRTALGADSHPRLWRVWATLRTFLVVNLGWYFDRIYDFGDSLTCLRATFLNFAPQLMKPTLAELFGPKAAGPLGVSYIAIIGCVAIFAVSLVEERGHDVRELVLSRGLLVRTCAYVALLFLIASSYAFSIGGAGGFMYANF